MPADKRVIITPLGDKVGHGNYRLGLALARMKQGHGEPRPIALSLVVEYIKTGHEPTDARLLRQFLYAVEGANQLLLQDEGTEKFSDGKFAFVVHNFTRPPLTQEQKIYIWEAVWKDLRHFGICLNDEEKACLFDAACIGLANHQARAAENGR